MRGIPAPFDPFDPSTSSGWRVGAGGLRMHPGQEVGCAEDSIVTNSTRPSLAFPLNRAHRWAPVSPGRRN